MKWFGQFAAAALLVSGVSAQADPFVRVSAAQPVSDPADGETPVVGAYAYPDFPAYPPGYSSYRGLGFWGTCCERISPCALLAWAGYCNEKMCCEANFGGSLRDTFPRSRRQGFGLFGGCRGGCEAPSPSDKVSAPMEAETELDEPAPEPLVPEAPEPRTTSVMLPCLSNPPSLERPASRTDLRRLPPDYSSTAGR